MGGLPIMDPSIPRLPMTPRLRKQNAERLSQTRCNGVQNGEARFAEVDGFAPLAGPATAGEKRGQVESGKTEKTSQTSQSSQTSQYSQMHCAGRESPANAGMAVVSRIREHGVQNAGGNC